MAVQLGSRVKDVITGFTGIAIGYSRWMYGCNRVVVEGETLKDGKPIGQQWFDEQRIETIEEGVMDVIPPENFDHIVMGNHYKDKITGFEGVAQAITKWSSGNVTISIEPTELPESGKPLDSQGFDAHRLELTQEQEIPISAESAAGQQLQQQPVPTGGPQNDPVQAM